MRCLNFPPVRRSFSLLGECQLGSAAFQCMMSAGVFHVSQTFATGAFANASTVILVTCAISSFFVYYFIQFKGTTGWKTATVLKTTTLGVNYDKLFFYLVGH